MDITWRTSNQAGSGFKHSVCRGGMAGLSHKKVVGCRIEKGPLSRPMLVWLPNLSSDYILFHFGILATVFIEIKINLVTLSITLISIVKVNLLIEGVSAKPL